MSFDAGLGGKVTDVANSRLLGGRSLWRLQAAADAPLGEFRIEAVLVTAMGVITTASTVKVIEPPKTKKKTITQEEPEKGPIVKWMHRDAWDDLGWDAQSVGEVQVRSDETLILLNRDQRRLEHALDRNKKLTKEQIETRAGRYLFPGACALYESSTTRRRRARIRRRPSTSRVSLSGWPRRCSWSSTKTRSRMRRWRRRRQIYVGGA